MLRFSTVPVHVIDVSWYKYIKYCVHYNIIVSYNAHALWIIIMARKGKGEFFYLRVTYIPLPICANTVKLLLLCVYARTRKRQCPIAHLYALRKGVYEIRCQGAILSLLSPLSVNVLNVHKSIVCWSILAENINLTSW